MVIYNTINIFKLIYIFLTKLCIMCIRKLQICVPSRIFAHCKLRTSRKITTGNILWLRDKWLSRYILSVGFYLSSFFNGEHLDRFRYLCDIGYNLDFNMVDILICNFLINPIPSIIILVWSHFTTCVIYARISLPSIISIYVSPIISYVVGTIMCSHYAYT